MSLITIDKEKCKRDGICTAVCPAKIIMQNDKESFPQCAPNAEPLCIVCGHCVSACPHDALSHERMAPEDCPSVKPELHLSPDHVEHLLRSRRSIRAYKAKPVPKETLIELVRIASHAPSGHNRQPVHWHIVYTREEQKRLNGLVADWMRSMIKEQPEEAASMHLDLIAAGWDFGIDVITRDAPHLILAHGLNEDFSAPAACIIAQSYLELAALSFGLGTCWAGIFNRAAASWAPIQEELGLPKEHAVFGSMLIGYPKFRYHRLPLRNEPKITIQD